MIKDDGLTIDSVDFWSPHSQNKGCGNLNIVKIKGFSDYDMKDSYESLVLNCDSECMASNDNKVFIQRLLNLFLDKLNVID